MGDYPGGLWDVGNRILPYGGYPSMVDSVMRYAKQFIDRPHFSADHYEDEEIEHCTRFSADPEDEEEAGQCDCCGEYRPLTHCWAFGIETYACDECRNVTP